MHQLHPATAIGSGIFTKMERIIDTDTRAHRTEIIIRCSTCPNEGGKGGSPAIRLETMVAYMTQHGWDMNVKKRSFRCPDCVALDRINNRIKKEHRMSNGVATIGDFVSHQVGEDLDGIRARQGSTIVQPPEQRPPRRAHDRITIRLGTETNGTRQRFALYLPKEFSLKVPEDLNRVKFATMDGRLVLELGGEGAPIRPPLTGRWTLLRPGLSSGIGRPDTKIPVQELQCTVVGRRVISDSQLPPAVYRSVIDRVHKDILQDRDCEFIVSDPEDDMDHDVTVPPPPPAQIDGTRFDLGKIDTKAFSDSDVLELVGMINMCQKARPDIHFETLPSGEIDVFKKEIIRHLIRRP